MKEKNQGLDATKYITPGSKLELVAIDRIPLPDGTFKTKRFESKVVEMIDDDEMEVFMPMDKTKLVLLPVNGQYDAHFMTPKGLFQCLVRVAERYKSGNFYLLRLEMVSGLQKYQRREYYRYACTIDMEARNLSEDENRCIEEQANMIYDDELPMDKAIIVDISGGGLRFVSSIPYEVETRIKCDYSLGDKNNSRSYEIVGKILSRKELENRPGSYEYRLMFLRIENYEREEIIRYIFEQERKNRNRERS